MATIKDVAKLAGVSIATVSNILNHKTYVSNEKYDKVMNAIETLNYNPSFLASNLRSNRTNIIHVIAPELNSFYSQILEGIMRVLEVRGYSIVLKLTDYSLYTENTILTELPNLGTSGVLTIGSITNSSKLYQNLLDKQIPVVSLCNDIKDYNIPSVIFDNRTTVFELTASIFQSNQDASIVLFTSSPEQTENADCILGFEDALRARGLTGMHYIVRPSRERCLVELFDILNNMAQFPQYFIASSQNIAESLSCVISYLGGHSIVYALGCDENYKNRDTHLIEMNRSCMLLGQKGATLLLEYMKAPVYFDCRREIVREPKQHYEKLTWPALPLRRNLRLLLVKSETTQSIQRMIPQFSQRYNIDISCDCLEYDTLYQTLIDHASSKKDAYDILMIDYPWLPRFCNDRFLMDLTPYIQADADEYIDSFFPIAQTEFIHYTPKIYIIPVLITMQFLFYRRDIFEDNNVKWHFFKKYGVELCIPKTWAEFDVIARYFTRETNPKSPVEFGSSFKGVTSVGMCEEFFPRQWSYKGSIVSSQGIVKCISPENRRALISLKKAYQCSPACAKDSVYSAQTILDGNIAMCVNYGTHISSAIKSRSDGAIDYNDILATNLPGNCPLFGGWSLGVNQYSKKPFESYMFIKWATSDQNAVINSMLGGLIPKKNLAEDIYVKNSYPWIDDIELKFASTKKRRRFQNQSGTYIDTSVTDQILYQNIIRYLHDEINTDDTLRLLQQSFERLLRR